MNMPENIEYPDTLDRSQLKRKLNEAANIAAAPMGARDVPDSSASSAIDQLDIMVDVNRGAGEALTKLADICRDAANRLSEGGGPGLPAGDHPSAGLVAIAKLLCDNIEPQRRKTGSLSVFCNGRRHRTHQ